MGGRQASRHASAGVLDGVAFLRALRPRLRERGVLLFEGTPALSILEGATCEVATPRGTVKAGTVVLATNAYTPALGYFRHGLFPLHSHVVATAALSADERRSAGWQSVAGYSDDLDRISYASLTPDDRILFGGGSNRAYGYRFGGRTAWTGEAPFDVVEARLRTCLPGVGALTHRWTGTLGITLSRVCSMGVTGDHRNVLYALGYSGHGVTLANLAGRVLTDIYSGADERWRGLPFYQRRLLTIPGEPLRWLGYHAYTALTGRSPRRDG